MQFRVLCCKCNRRMMAGEVWLMGDKLGTFMHVKCSTKEAENGVPLVQEPTTPTER